MHAPLLCFRKPSTKGKSVQRDDGRRKREKEEERGMVTMTNGRFHRLNKYQGTRDICAQSSRRGITPFNGNKYKIACPLPPFLYIVQILFFSIEHCRRYPYYLFSHRCLDINFGKLRYLVREKESKQHFLSDLKLLYVLAV